MRASGCGLLAGTALLIAAAAAGPAIGQVGGDDGIAGGGDRSAKIGVLAGVGLSRFGGEASEVEGRAGPAFGAYLNVPARDALSLQVELMLVQKGTKNVFLGWFEYSWNDWRDGIAHEECRLTYLELHLLGKRPVIVGEGAYLLVGLSAGYLVDRRGTLIRAYEESSYGPAERLTSEDAFNDITRGDAAALAGFGLTFPIGEETRLLLEARYEHGLVDVSRRVNSDFRNRSLTLLTGVEF